MRLVLENVGIPSDSISMMAHFGNVWESVLSSKELKDKFIYDPNGFLIEHGIPSSVLESRDQEVVLLKAMTDNDVLAAALSGDYIEFIRKLKEHGVTTAYAKSNLKKNVVSALHKNIDDVKKRLRNRSYSPGKANTHYAKANELAFLYGQLTPSIEQVAMAAVPVALAAIVVVYVSVGVAVTVGVLAGVAVSVAVATAVTVGSGEMCAEVSKYQLFAGPAATPSLSRTERQRVMEGAIAQRELIGKRMLKLSPEMLEEAQKQARLARLLNQDKFILETNRQLVKDEVTAFLEAAEQSGLISIPMTNREEVVRVIQSIALRATALD